LILVMALVLPAFAKSEPAPAPTPAPAPKPAEPTTLKFAYMMPKGMSLAAGFDWFGPEFEKRTDGRYKVEMYPGGVLFQTDASLDSVKKGVAEITMSSIGNFEKAFPLSSATLNPTVGFPGSEKGLKAAWQAFWEMYNKFPEIQNEYKDYKLLWYYQLQPYNLVSLKKEIHMPTDFKGLKVGGSGTRMEIVKAGGGAEVKQVPPDAYMNMDKKLVDASFITFSQTGIYKVYEIANYFYDLNFGSGAIPVLMNMDAWNAMSEEDQKIMDGIWPDAADVSAKAMEASSDKGVKGILAEGKKITVPTLEETLAWQKSAAPVFESWAATSKSLGAKNPEAILAEWIKLSNAYKP